MDNQDDFQVKWNKIRSLERQGLFSSALMLLDSLQKEASEKGDKQNIIKALFCKTKCYVKLKKDPGEAIINDFELALQSESETNYQRIYNSILGELYYRYAFHNQDLIKRRAVADNEEVGLGSWSIEKIVARCNLHYQQSVQNLDFEKLDFENYKLLISPYALPEQSFDLCSVLYMRAIDHFKVNRKLFFGSESDSTFLLRNEIAFCPAEEFVKFNFETGNNENHVVQALHLFQRLLDYHGNTLASEKIDVQRLAFVHRIHQSENRDALYHKQLQESSSTSHYAKYTLAKIFENKKNNQKSYDLLKELRASNIDSSLLRNVKSSLKSLESRSLFVSVEEVYIPNEPSLFQIKYKNISEIEFTIKKRTDKIMNEMKELNLRQQRMNKDQIEMIKSLQTQHTWKQKIPDSHYVSLSSELIMPALPLGQYFLLSSTSYVGNEEHMIGDWSKEIFNCHSFQVSNLTYSATKNPNDDLELVIADRKLGIPKENVKVIFYTYEDTYRNKNKIIVTEKTTDKKGVVEYPYKNLEGKSFKVGLRLHLDDDILDFEKMHTPSHTGKCKYKKIYAFTDRNIYRPKQRIHLKAIVFSDDDKVCRGEKVVILLFNSKNKEIYREEKVTNQYGSISTDFILPVDAIIGDLYFHIELSKGFTNIRTRFKIREYKKPSFFVELEKSKNEFSFGDLITLNGKIVMYSGSAVQHAKIEYRVIRNQFHINKRKDGTAAFGRGAESEFGCVESDENGQFTLIFDFKRDEKYTNLNESIYIFIVDIIATTTSGEIQYFREQIKISRKKVFISTNFKEENIRYKRDYSCRFMDSFITNMKQACVTLDKLDSIRFYVKDINDNNIAFKGKILIHSLKSPSTFKRNKRWGCLDVAILTDAEYDTLPYDYKLNKNDVDNWLVDQEVYSEEFDALTGEHTISLTPQNKNTYYRIEILNNETGEIEFESILKIIDPKNSYLDKQSLFNYDIEKESLNPGEKAVINIASENVGLQLFYQLEKGYKIIDKKWINLIEKRQRIELPIIDEDKGGFYIHLIAFYQNRCQTEKIKIIVPHDDMKLQLKLDSFKTELKAGSQEEWKIRTVDNKGNNVRSEILVSMYNSSLDKLGSTHQWKNMEYYDFHSQLNNVSPGYSLTKGKHTSITHGTWKSKTGKYSPNYFPSINTFGFSPHDHMRYPDTNDDLVRHGRKNKNPKNSAFMYSRLSDFENYKTDLDWSQIGDVHEDTVFFYPDLVTDENGEASLSFKMSDDLSSWKLLVFAHDKQGRHALETFSLKSVKQ